MKAQQEWPLEHLLLHTLKGVGISSHPFLISQNSKYVNILGTKKINKNKTYTYKTVLVVFDRHNAHPNLFHFHTFSRTALQLMDIWNKAPCGSLILQGIKCYTWCSGSVFVMWRSNTPQLHSEPVIHYSKKKNNQSINGEHSASSVTFTSLISWSWSPAKRTERCQSCERAVGRVTHALSVWWQRLRKRAAFVAESSDS